MKNILLVEPGYKNKYPPIGLMKISTFHKGIGDRVVFIKGLPTDEIKAHVWDKIYVTTLFTFDFDVSVKTINSYKSYVASCDDIFVGGIMASLMKERLIDATGLQERNIITGLLTDSKQIHESISENIDELPLDYDILDTIDYQYPAGDNYFAYTTRGCPNKCKFCAVPLLEPYFQVTNNILEQLRTIDAKYGTKQNLLLLDNNILNAPNLSDIVDDLISAGFSRGSSFIPTCQFQVILKRYHNGERASFLDNKLRSYLATIKKRIPSGQNRTKFLELLVDADSHDDYAEYILSIENEIEPLISKYRSKSKRLRSVDFNQGIDARRINDKTMSLLAKLEIRPLRIAFDDIRFEKIYTRAVKLAHKYGVTDFSNYILFNYEDKPEDLYRRLECNIKLNEELGTKIFSFPMKYSPIDRTDRAFIGENWNFKYLTAISAILHVTRGVVAAGSGFFYKAFGNNIDEYFELLAMPRDMIMYRFYYEGNGITAEWKNLYSSLTKLDKKELLCLVSHTTTDLKKITPPAKFKSIWDYYLIKHKSDSKSQQKNEQISFLTDIGF